MVTFLLLSSIICSTADILWQQPMDSSDFSGWVADGNVVEYRSNDMYCPYNNKCWKLCGELSGDWTSHLTLTTPISTIGKINTRLTFDIETTSFTNECSIEWSKDNWNNVNEIVSKSTGYQNRQAQTVTFTGADDSDSVSIRIRVFEGHGDCCYISRFVLEADPTESSAPTTQPTNIPTTPTVPTTAYPTAGDGKSIRVIIGTWNDDYSITGPVRWYATRDTNNYGSTEYTPPILTGNNGKYHGVYAGEVGQDFTRYYMSLYQTFLCSAHAKVDISFTVIICATENDDNFYFYVDDVEKESFTISTSSLSWSSLGDSAVSCSDGSPEQNTFSYTDVLEVMSNTDSFEVKFHMDSNAVNEAILVTNIAIVCNIITSSPTTNPSDTTVSPTNIPTHSPITIAPTVPTTNPVVTTLHPTNVDGVSVRIITDTWNDDYSISNPFKWQTLMDGDDPPTTPITPPIFTGNEGEYHGPYQSLNDGYNRYAILWQQFRCDSYSMVDVSFTLLTCGTEGNDYFEFYFNDIISSDGTVSLGTSTANWDSITDSLISCSSGSPKGQKSFSYSNLAEVQANDAFEIKFFMRMDSDNEALWINNISVACHATTASPTNNPTTSYPTISDGTSIRIIYNKWNDDYVTSNPVKWQAVRSKQDPPTATITPYIFTGNNGQYHGPYQSDSSSDRFYALLWQKFRCSQHSMIHISFTLVICGTEGIDEFTFYLDDTASHDGTISLSEDANNWNSVTDSAISCSGGSPEQNSYNYTDLREVQSIDIFEVKFKFVYDSTNEGIWVTDVSITCDNIQTNNPSSMPTFNPSKIPTNDPTIVTNNPTTTPTISNPTTSPTNIPTQMPTKTPTLHPSLMPSMHPSIMPSMHPSLAPTLYPSPAPTSFPTMRPTNLNGEVGDEKTTMYENDSNDNEKLQNTEQINWPLFIYVGIAAVVVVISIVICMFMLKKRKAKSSKKDMNTNHENMQMEMTLNKVNSYTEYGKTTNGHLDIDVNGANGAISLPSEGVSLASVVNIQVTNDVLNINDDMTIGAHETLGGMHQNENEFIIENEESDDDILMHVNTKTVGGPIQQQVDTDENDTEQNTSTEGDDVIDDEYQITAGSNAELLNNDEFIVENENQTEQ